MYTKLNETVIGPKGAVMLTVVDTIVGQYYAILNLKTRELRTVAQDKAVAITIFNNELNNFKRAI
jgi:hypothetical protein